MDPYSFFMKSGNTLQELIGVFVDDTANAGGKHSRTLEDVRSKRFDKKPTETKFPFNINWSLIEKSEATTGALIPCHQKAYAAAGSKLPPEDFSNLRGQLGYIASCLRPNTALAFAKTSKTTPDEAAHDKA